MNKTAILDFDFEKKIKFTMEPAPYRTVLFVTTRDVIKNQNKYDGYDRNEGADHSHMLDVKNKPFDTELFGGGFQIDWTKSCKTLKMLLGMV